MMRSTPPPSRDAMADGISIRVRVRRAISTSKLEIGDPPQDMVCTIVNWEFQGGGGGSKRKPGGSPRRQSFANKFRSNSSSKTDPLPYGKIAPTLVFQARTQPGPTLEACCSLHSVSSYDSMDDPSIISESLEETSAEEQIGFIKSKHNDLTEFNRRKKTYAVPCSGIKTVEKVSSLFRGYRIFFATSSRGSYELEFENKNGMDIMMAFLQANLPAERFVNLSSGSVDGSDTASYLSTLDVEKLTERLAERQSEESISEKVRKGVGRMVSGIEEMSSSFCGNVCCGSGSFMMGSSVAPYVPVDEIRDSPPRVTTKTLPRFETFNGPVMEIDEETSTQSSVIVNGTGTSVNDKRRYLKEHKLPSGLSMEMPE